jgi:hypothetical protein
MSVYVCVATAYTFITLLCDTAIEMTSQSRKLKILNYKQHWKGVLFGVALKLKNVFVTPYHRRLRQQSNQGNNKCNNGIQGQCCNNMIQTINNPKQDHSCNNVMKDATDMDVSIRCSSLTLKRKERLIIAKPYATINAVRNIHITTQGKGK